MFRAMYCSFLVSRAAGAVTFAAGAARFKLAGAVAFYAGAARFKLVGAARFRMPAFLLRNLSVH